MGYVYCTPLRSPGRCASAAGEHVWVHVRPSDLAGARQQRVEQVCAVHCTARSLADRCAGASSCRAHVGTARPSALLTGAREQLYVEHVGATQPDGESEEGQAFYRY